MSRLFIFPIILITSFILSTGCADVAKKANSMAASVKSSLPESLSKSHEEEKAPPQQVLYNETFDSHNGWEEEKSHNYLAKIAGGAYNFQMAGNVGRFEQYYPVYINEKYDYTIETQVKRFFGEDSKAFGMKFGIKYKGAYKDYYSFHISSDGSFWIGKAVNSKTAETLKDWTPSPAIIKGRFKTNKLKVAKLGSRTYFYINGTEVHKEWALPLPGNGVGLIAYGPNILKFNYLKVTGVPDTEKPKTAPNYPNYKSVELCKGKADTLGFINCSPYTFFDVRTNLVWTKRPLLSILHDTLPSTTTKGGMNRAEADRWLRHLNDMNYGGMTDWNYPDPWMYKSLKMDDNKNIAKKCTDPRNRTYYLPKQMECMNYVDDLFIKDPVKQYDFRRARIEDLDSNGYTRGLYAVRPGDLSFSAIFHYEKKPLPKAQEDIFEKALTATKAGLRKEGAALFQKALMMNPSAMFEHQAWYRMFSVRMDYHYISEVFTANYDQYGNRIKFWIDYGHYANFAAQPGMLKLASIRIKERIPNLQSQEKIKAAERAATIFDALAEAHAGNFQGAYSILLMAAPHDDYLLVRYINTFGDALKKDMNKLATVMGLPKNYFYGSYGKADMKPIQNPETGTNIGVPAPEAVKPAPSGNTGTKPKPAPKPSGATILE
ncbi:hypothetical protein [Limisalsivibrio acetivorans]|uniref:hypothetical protein n=1 Tax=Limisalsivibrio acetivorans TaxID=1304888 RepID=UPI0003B3D379|nr:hypothetical protein [Limisalsivibrio acetivorans]